MTPEEQKNRIRLALSQFLPKKDVEACMPKVGSDDLMDLITSQGGLGVPTPNVSTPPLKTPTGGGTKDTPTGGGTKDTPTGGGGKDSPIIGGEDTPTGGGGDDTPTGGGGDDTPTGGGGDDTPTGGGDDDDEKPKYKVGDKVRIKGRSGDNVGVVSAINPDGTYVIKKVTNKEDTKFSDGGSVASDDEDEIFNQDEIEPYRDFREGIDELVEQLTFAKNYSFKLDSFIRMVCVDHLENPEYDWIDDTYRETLYNKTKEEDIIIDYVWDRIATMIKLALQYFYWLNFIKKIKKSGVVNVFIDDEEITEYFDGIKHYYNKVYTKGRNNSRIDWQKLSVLEFSIEDLISFLESVSIDTDWQRLQDEKFYAKELLKRFSKLKALDNYYFKIITYGCISNPNIININYYLQEHINLLFIILKNNEFNFFNWCTLSEMGFLIQEELKDKEADGIIEKNMDNKPINMAQYASGEHTIISIKKYLETIYITELNNYNSTNPSSLKFYTDKDFITRIFKNAQIFNNLTDFFEFSYIQYKDLFNVNDKKMIEQFSKRLSINMILFVKDSLNKIRSLTNQFREYF